MNAENLSLSGLKLITPIVHADERGYFKETYNETDYHAAGIFSVFKQDNHSRSVHGVIRGIKFQLKPPADKLVRVAVGEVYAVALDIRTDSPTFGKWESVTLSADNHKQLFMPAGFAFGFCAVSEYADVLYKLSEEHVSSGSGTIRFDDPELGIPWPTENPMVTDGDRAAPTLREWRASVAP